MGVNVAYPGRDGAHSAAACDSLFPDGAELVPLPSFTAVVEAASDGTVEFGVLPIESSLTGPVAETHDLLYDSPLSINGETILPIRHCLVGPESITLEEIRVVRSHPAALDQCRRLLAAMPWATAIAAATTADAAHQVSEHGDPHEVAIASERAAKAYGLAVIAGDDGDHPEARRSPPGCVLGRPQRIRVQNDTGLPASLPRNDQRVPATSDVPPNPPSQEPALASTPHRSGCRNPPRGRRCEVVLEPIFGLLDARLPLPDIRALGPTRRERNRGSVQLVRSLGVVGDAESVRVHGEGAVRVEPEQGRAACPAPGADEALRRRRRLFDLRQWNGGRAAGRRRGLCGGFLSFAAAGRENESHPSQSGDASDGHRPRILRLGDSELLLESRVLALDPHARALVKALRARPIPGIDDERDGWAAPAVELDERLVEERETQPPPTPAAGDGELANPALALVVRADDAPRQLVPGEGEEPEGGVERPALDVVSLPLLEGLERPTALVVREGARDHPVHGLGIALGVERAHRDSLRPLGFRRRLVQRKHHPPVRAHRAIAGPPEQLAAGLVGRAESLAEDDRRPGRRALERPALDALEQPGADPLPAVLGVHEHVGVPVEAEQRVARESSLGRFRHPRVPLEVKAWAAPIREEVIELEVRRAEFVDVERDDEIGHRLRVGLDRGPDPHQSS